MGVSRRRNDETITSLVLHMLKMKRMLNFPNDCKGRKGVEGNIMADDETEMSHSSSEQEKQERQEGSPPAIDSHHEEPDRITKQCRSRSRSESRSIHFNSAVKVITIPSHLDYPVGVKKIIWSNFAEINQNAKRNRREFAAEGWKWENAVEEDDMYLDKFSNERIHPCHLGGCILDLR